MYCYCSARSKCIMYHVPQVETFGSMEKTEKVEFILEQMRLCLAKKDYIRTSIISKKINTRFFTNKENVDVSFCSSCLVNFKCVYFYNRHWGMFINSLGGNKHSFLSTRNFETSLFEIIEIVLIDRFIDEPNKSLIVCLLLQ